MDGRPDVSMEMLDPADDQRGFRQALGAFATGITVVTTLTEDGPAGITANSFASVSLDPPLVLWSPDKGSRRFTAFATAPFYAIHVLAADQKPIGDGFMRSKSAFDGLDWIRGAGGVPLLSGALAIYECELEARHDAGDHAIVLGRVLRVHRREGRPLVFHGGAYGTFAGLAPGRAPPEG